MRKFLFKDRATWHLNAECVGDAGCWVWKHNRTRDGYGTLRFEGKVRRAHRVAYQLFVGEIPDGKVIRHTCHNPPCCNPAHLLIGTQQDNIQDMMDAGRQFSERRSHGPRPAEVVRKISEGLKHQRAAMRANGIRPRNGSRRTMADAAKIRALAATGIPRMELAMQLGMSRSGLQKIISGRVFSYGD